MRLIFSPSMCAAVLVLMLAAPPAPGYQPVPDEVIYDFTTNGFTCDPDNWNFFGPITTDFGWDPQAEDGSGAYQAGDWTLQSGWGMGTAIGVGPFSGQPLCGGVPRYRCQLWLLLGRLSGYGHDN